MSTHSRKIKNCLIIILFAAKMNEAILSLINEVCLKIHELVKSQVVFLDKNNNRLSGKYTSNMTPPYKENTTNYLIDLFKDTSIQNRPLIICSKEGLYYLGIDLLLHNVHYGKYIIGPFVTKTYKRIEIILMYDKNNEIYDIDLIMNYYKCVKKISYEAICTYGTLCKNMINEYFDSEENTLFFQTNTAFEMQLIRNEDIINQKEYLHNGYNSDKIMIECVKNGYPGEIKRFIQDYWTYTGRRELLKGTLRDRKNFTISYLAMLVQAAIEGGMDYEYASNLNLKYISLVEKKTTSIELEKLELDVLYDLSKQVRSLKRQGNTKLIRDCKDYIMENISLNLKVQFIASYFDVDSKYLSRRFKAETNETIKNYINRKKIEEAKRIMQSSNISLIDLAANLSFHDQSHFTKIFKEFTGETPKQYYKRIKSK